MYWLLGTGSELSLNKKLILYKSNLKTDYLYGIQLWGTPSKHKVEILQRYQLKALSLLANAPWFICNKSLHSDLKIRIAKSEVKTFSERYLSRLSNRVFPRTSSFPEIAGFIFQFPDPWTSRLKQKKSYKELQLCLKSIHKSNSVIYILYIL